MAKPKITPVKDNKNKGNNYTKHLAMYNKAMENGFYGEAELIVYAFLEDRLRSYLYYIGALDRWNSIAINNDTQLLFGDSEKNKSIYNISDKRDVIKKIISALNDKDFCKTSFGSDLKLIYSYLDVKEIKSELKNLENWCEYRNEIIHALFNKDMNELHNTYKSHVEEGYRLARYFDSIVNKIKKI